MKKKIRQITVDDNKYNWSVIEQNWPEAKLFIWIEGKKTKPWCCASFSLDEKQSITPEIVSKTIKKVLAAKGNPPERITNTFEIMLK